MRLQSFDVVLFDLGNVILPFNHYPIAEKLAPFSQNEKYRDSREVFSYLFNLDQGAVNDYETGKLVSGEFFQSLKKTLRLSLSIEEFITIWNDIFTEDQEVSAIVHSLKGQKRLGLLSNTNPLHFSHVLKTYPIIRIFDRWILSYEAGFKKPAVPIFQKALEWAAVEPSRVLFIDDIEKHVEVAVSLGMTGIHFVSAGQLKKEFDNL